MDCRTVQQNIMPYIERKLTETQLEEFLDHIDTCPACREELEVYYTIYYALDKLDQEEEASFNIKELLEKDIRKERGLIQKRESLQFTRKLVIVVLGTIFAVLLTTGIEGMIKGDIRLTTVYRLIAAEEEEPDEEESVHLSSETTAIEPETNHKKQIVITVPETEQYVVPGPIPDGI